MDDRKFEACLDGGVNRFSFGVQSFNTKVRKSIGRVLNQEAVNERLRYARDQARATVVIDLMYGLPYQTPGIWQRDLEAFDELELDGCDLYQLIVFENSDLEKKVEAQTISRTATVQEQSRMFEYAICKMRELGYTRLSNCHWAIGNRERSMYNSLTISNAIVVPFGSGSGGNASGHRFFLHPSLDHYEELVEKGQKPLMAMMKSSPHQNFYRMISGSMSEGGLNIHRFNENFGSDSLKDFDPLFNVWEKKGVIKRDGSTIELTVAGQFWSVNLAQAMVDWHQRLMSAGNDVKGDGHSAQQAHHPSHPKHIKRPNEVHLRNSHSSSSSYPYPQKGVSTGVENDDMEGDQ
jgi:oxygen-independent coproporphyrinogen-3 oxidase